MVNCTGRVLVVKRPGVLSKAQMLNLVLGVGVFSLLPKNAQALASIASYAPAKSTGSFQERRCVLEFKVTSLFL